METKRLILRPWELTDLETLYDLCIDPHVGPDCGWKPHKDIKESQFVLENILMVKNTFAIVLKETNQVIGNISIFKSEYNENENQAEIGYWLGYPYWGNGYMPEACEKVIQFCFNELHLEKIWCGHFETNHNSSRVQEKCGFKYHHTDTQHYLAQLDKTVVGIVNVLERKEWD